MKNTKVKTAALLAIFLSLAMGFLILGFLPKISDLLFLVSAILWLLSGILLNELISFKSFSKTIITNLPKEIEIPKKGMYAVKTEFLVLFENSKLKGISMRKKISSEEVSAVDIYNYETFFGDDLSSYDVS